MLTQQPSSCRSGGEQFLAEPSPPGPRSFGAWHELTPGCSGPCRVARFLASPPAVQNRAWLDLARRCATETARELTEGCS